MVPNEVLQTDQLSAIITMLGGAEALQASEVCSRTSSAVIAGAAYSLRQGIFTLPSAASAQDLHVARNQEGCTALKINGERAVLRGVRAAKRRAGKSSLLAYHVFMGLSIAIYDFFARS
jgi:hypothetical protein